MVRRFLEINVQVPTNREVLRSEDMEYQGEMLCSGYSHKMKPCDRIKECDLCVGLNVDANGNEMYICGLGVADFK